MSQEVIIPIATLIVGYLMHFFEGMYRDRIKYEREKREKINEKLYEFLTRLNRYSSEMINGFHEMHIRKNEPGIIAVIQERIDVTRGQYNASKAIIELYGNDNLNTRVEEYSDALLAVIEEFVGKAKNNALPEAFKDLQSSDSFFSKKKQVLLELHKTMGIKFQG